MGLRDTTRSPRYNRADRSGKLLLSCGMLGRPPGMCASSVFATIYLSPSPPLLALFSSSSRLSYTTQALPFSFHRSNRPFPFLSPFSSCAPSHRRHQPHPVIPVSHPLDPLTFTHPSSRILAALLVDAYTYTLCCLGKLD